MASKNKYAIESSVVPRKVFTYGLNNLTLSFTLDDQKSQYEQYVILLEKATKDLNDLIGEK